MRLVRYIQEVCVANSANCKDTTTINEDDNAATSNNNSIELLSCVRQYSNHFHALTHIIFIIAYRHTHILFLLIFLPRGFIGLDRNHPW